VNITALAAKPIFVRALQRFMPELAEKDLDPGASGLRAQALDNNGSLDDFHFVYTDGMVQVSNAVACWRPLLSLLPSTS
jgi:L-2-hydroxyglutarate oxidase